MGKLGLTASSEDCKSVVENVFSGLAGQEKFCFINAAMKYHDGHIISLSIDQDPPKPARMLLALMVIFLFGISSFIDCLIPVTTLKSEFLMEQLMMLLQIILDAGRFVFLVMTDNLSVNQKMFTLLNRIHIQKSIATALRITFTSS